MMRILSFALQFIVIGLAVAFVLMWLQPAWQKAPASPVTSYSDAVNRTAPSVVSIYTRTMVTEPLGSEFSDPLFSHLYRNRTVTRPRRGLGSGVIISDTGRSEEHTSELQSRGHLVCRLLLEQKKTRHSPMP